MFMSSTILDVVVFEWNILRIIHWMEIVQSYYLKSRNSTTYNCLFLQIKSPLGFPMIEVFAHLKRIAKNRWHKAIKMYVVH